MLKVDQGISCFGRVYFTSVFCGAGSQTQCFTHASQILPLSCIPGPSGMPLRMIVTHVVQELPVSQLLSVPPWFCISSLSPHCVVFHHTPSHSPPPHASCPSAAHQLFPYFRYRGLAVLFLGFSHSEVSIQLVAQLWVPQKYHPQLMGPTQGANGKEE